MNGTGPERKKILKKEFAHDMIVDKKTDDVMATENQKARKRKEVLKVISEMCFWTIT